MTNLRPFKAGAKFISASVIVAILCSNVFGGINLTFKSAGQRISSGLGNAGNAPPNAVGGGNLQTVVRAAADWWEERLNFGSKVVNINFGWGPRAGGVAATYNGGGIMFDNDGTSVNGTTYNFFNDQTPYWNEEFQSGLSIKTSTYNAVQFIDEYEMQGSNGNVIDLFDTALHELGHALGCCGDANINITNPAIRGIDGKSMAGVTLPFVSTGGGHLSISNDALMNTGTTIGNRTMISDVDAAAVAQRGNFPGTTSPVTATRNQNVGLTGFFHEPLYWNFGHGNHLSPDAMTSVIFAGNTTPYFAANEESKTLDIQAGDVTLHLSGYRYRLHGYQTASFPEIVTDGEKRALRVRGSAAAGNGILRLRDAGSRLQTPNVWIDGPANPIEYPTLDVGAGVTLNVTTVQFQVGRAQRGKVIQNGTVNAKAISLGVTASGKGVYEMNAGTLSTDVLVVGDVGQGTFVQYGGTVNVYDEIDLGLNPGGNGTYDFRGGTLHVVTFNGDLTNKGGILAPGDSIGSTSVMGDYTQMPAGRLLIELASPSSFDKLLVSGTASLGGILDIDLTNGFIPTPGMSFRILDWATHTGTFAPFPFPTLPNSWQWNTSLLYSSGILSVVDSALLGDFNANGIVDAADYVVWRKGLGTTYTQNDYTIWRANFGRTAGSGSAPFAQSAVPEPSTGLLLLMVVGTVICRRCRVRSGIQFSSF